MWIFCHRFFKVSLVLGGLFNFFSGSCSLQYKAERLGWGGSLLLQTEAELIGDYSRKRLTIDMYFIWPHFKKHNYPFKYSPFHLYNITPGEHPHLCSLAAHTLRRFYTVGPASPSFRHISAETLDFCSEHSEGSLSISLGRVHPHLPDIYPSPEPTPARHQAGLINHIYIHSKTACQTCWRALPTLYIYNKAWFTLDPVENGWDRKVKAGSTFGETQPNFTILHHISWYSDYDWSQSGV